MQQIEATAAANENGRRRVESVVQTLATLRSEGESLAEIAHDARNMVTALGLYCDLLSEPGVLTAEFAHYGSELRLVAAASRRLVEKLVVLDAPAPAPAGFWRSDAPEAERWPARLPAASPAMSSASNLRSAVSNHSVASPLVSVAHWEMLPSAPVANLAAEMLATRNLLTALAGPSIGLTVDTEGGAQPVRISCEDLTRVLVNLVKNAVEAMPAGGRIQITLREQAAGEAGSNAADAARRLALVIEDNGPGIPADALEKIFESGYSGHRKAAGSSSAASHRGLGLAISRSIVERAGGRIYAENRPAGGARMVIELPVA